MTYVRSATWLPSVEIVTEVVSMPPKTIIRRLSIHQSTLIPFSSLPNHRIFPTRPHLLPTTALARSSNALLALVLFNLDRQTWLTLNGVKTKTRLCHVIVLY
ncbi:hypothetical protein OPV22_023780 [Ensete ventricosum]|uniref:Uncharacterized protein n=1 Tax=Ensete ventricosum TaxID=4639 RepID=A0AAV8QST9_ENSVE|nr:hypothetical protein OPV22_023780 [Ensete ventricosum]